MPYWRLHYHLVWATCGRALLIWQEGYGALTIGGRSLAAVILVTKGVQSGVVRSAIWAKSVKEAMSLLYCSQRFW